MPRLVSLLVALCLAILSVDFATTRVEAFSGFKGRFNSACESVQVNVCRDGRLVQHQVEAANYGERVLIEEGYQRDLELICQRESWKVKSQTGSCGRWVTGAWGSCSKSCGGGVKTRSVQCFQPTGGGAPDNQGMAPDYACSSLSKPAESTSCNTQACPTPSCPPNFDLQCGHGPGGYSCTCLCNGQGAC